MRTLIQQVKKYWDILGGTIIGLVASFIVNWQIEKIQLIYSVIILILMFIGIFKVFADKFGKTKKRVEIEPNDVNFVDKMMSVQKPIKALKLSQNPTEDGEEIGKLIIESMKEGEQSMKKIKDFFKWIWTYRQQILGLLGAFAYAVLVTCVYVFDKFEWILSFFPATLGWEIAIKVLVGLLSAIFLFFEVRNQVKWVGVGSLTTAKKYLDEKANGTVTKLSPQAKNLVQRVLKVLNTELKKLKAGYNKLLKEIEIKQEELKPLEELLTKGIYTNEEVAKIKNEIATLNVQLQETSANIEVYEAQITEYTNKLNEFQ